MKMSLLSKSFYWLPAHIALIKRLVINDKVDFDTAKILIAEYKKIGAKS